MGAYFVVLAAIAAWAARRTKSATDFFVAGRSLGMRDAQTLADIGYYVLALMTVMAAFDQIGKSRTGLQQDANPSPMQPA